MNFLIEDFLKIHTSDHSKIQKLIKDYFLRCRYEALTEKPIISANWTMINFPMRRKES